MDGSWGYTAEQGLKAVLGGINIDAMNRHEGAMSPAEMRKYIEDAPSERNVSYSDEARRFAKAVLLEADKDSTNFSNPANSKEITDLVTRTGDFDLTGFMFGWAVNAVHYVLTQNLESNPAIMRIQ